jgi:hypothetical protein
VPIPLASTVGDVATIAGVVVAILVPTILWWRGRQRKGIAYRLTTPNLVSVRAEAEDRITILYGDNPVENVRLVDLRVESTGNQEILPEDC